MEQHQSFLVTSEIFFFFGGVGEGEVYSIFKYVYIFTGIIQLKPEKNPK